MEKIVKQYWKDKDRIAKLTSYGSYLDCEFITAKYPDDEVHIVGDLAEYVYDLEQEVKNLKQQLAEKDKIWSFECEQLNKDRLDVEHQLEITEHKLAEERKKVVQEIKEKSYKHEMIPDHADEPCGYEYRISEKRLNEIERGEHE